MKFGRRSPKTRFDAVILPSKVMRTCLTQILLSVLACAPSGKCDRTDGFLAGVFPAPIAHFLPGADPSFGARLLEDADLRHRDIHSGCGGVCSQTYQVLKATLQESHTMHAMKIHGFVNFVATSSASRFVERQYFEEENKQNNSNNKFNSLFAQTELKYKKEK